VQTPVHQVVLTAGQARELWEHAGVTRLLLSAPNFIPVFAPDRARPGVGLCVVLLHAGLLWLATIYWPLQLAVQDVREVAVQIFRSGVPDKERPDAKASADSVAVNRSAQLEAAMARNPRSITTQRVGRAETQLDLPLVQDAVQPATPLAAQQSTPFAGTRQVVIEKKSPVAEVAVVPSLPPVTALPATPVAPVVSTVPAAATLSVAAPAPATSPLSVAPGAVSATVALPAPAADTPVMAVPPLAITEPAPDSAAAAVASGALANVNANPNPNSNSSGNLNENAASATSAGGAGMGAQGDLDSRSNRLNLGLPRFIYRPPLALPRRSLAEQANEQLRRKPRDAFADAVEGAGNIDCLKETPEGPAQGLLAIGPLLKRAIEEKCKK
jgi:hypothetical protein